jgi:hypothetical protein
MHEYRELKQSYNNLATNYERCENEYYLNTFYNITNNELKNNLPKLKKKKEEIADKLYQMKLYSEERHLMELLNHGLKLAHENGVPIFSSRIELLQHMITHPRDISLVNCYRHYPRPTTLLASNAIFTSLMLYYDFLIPEVFFFSVMIAAAALMAVNDSYSYKDSVFLLLYKKGTNNAYQAEFENYKNTANMLQLKTKKPKKTLGQKIDELIKKINSYRSKS